MQISTSDITEKMTRRAEFFVHPLFYEALSGEFYPPSDPGGPTHTLGRLAYTASKEGREAIGPDGIIEAGRTGYFYNLPWAPKVDADVFCDNTGRLQILSKLFFVAMREDGKVGPELVIDHDVAAEDPSQHALTLHDATGDTTFMLDLDTIDDTRLVVAQHAQRFFEDAV